MLVNLIDVKARFFPTLQVIRNTLALENRERRRNLLTLITGHFLSARVRMRFLGIDSQQSIRLTAFSTSPTLPPGRI